MVKGGKGEERALDEGEGRLGPIIHQGVNSCACYLDTFPPVFLPPPLVLVPGRRGKWRDEERGREVDAGGRNGEKRDREKR